MFDDAGGVGKPRVGQIALSYDPDRAGRGQAGDGAVPLVHRQLESQRRAPGSRVVRRRVQDGARRRRVTHRCRAVPTSQRHIAGIREFETAGFTHIALVQVGGDTQEQFISWAATELLPALRTG